MLTKNERQRADQIIREKQELHRGVLNHLMTVKNAMWDTAMWTLQFRESYVEYEQLINVLEQFRVQLADIEDALLYSDMRDYVNICKHNNK